MTRQTRENGFGLVELTVAGAIFAIVLVIVGNYLVSSTRTVNQSTAHQDDTAAAQKTLNLLDTNVRFACDMSISGGTLYVANTEGSCSTQGQPACAEWSTSGGNLTEKSSSGIAKVANGVSGLAFSSNASYNGLVTFQFNLRQAQDQSADPTGVTVNETVTAENMSRPVPSGTALSGCP